MKTNNLLKRIRKDRPMTMISLRIPEDVIDDLKRIAPLLGFSGYQALIKAYIGQGLRADIEHLEGELQVSALLESLRKRGVSEEILKDVVAEMEI